MFAYRLRRPAWIVGLIVMMLSLAWFAFASWPDRAPIRIEIIIKSTDDSIEFWKVLKDGANVAAEEFGAEVKVTGARSDADVDGQISRVEEAISRKPDAIILSANDFNRLVPVAKKVAAGKIRFFIVDSGINADIARSAVATDNVKAGKEAGQALLDTLEGPADVAIINYGSAGASLIDREKGVRSVLDEQSGIRLLATYDAQGQEDNAYLYTKRAIAEHPELRGIVGLNEPTSVGAGRAIRELGMSDRIRLIGFDSSINEVKLLEEGIMQATIIQNPFQMGYLSVKTAVDSVRGKEVPKRIDTGSLTITRDNMYEEENQKLLFPFYE
ncbi:substrate-binding domain-containing protein [Cohnella fermenti]|uniref:LacI family transcriptional regulator n=1 Tax=Cohnella fermenti TaxID=2565925 RepID=A0A4S4BKJ4_9BACL|nr:substrate-binding domain-containing protein [Cohnella fermenti]THF75244.1 LacI family transcriptional regulator [Cohnella fermenti]